MTIYTKSSIVVRKEPQDTLIDCKFSGEPARVGAIRSRVAVRRSVLFLLTVSTLLVASMGVLVGFLVYSTCVAGTSVRRYQGFCSVPIPRNMDSNYQVVPLRWSSDPDVQLLTSNDPESDDLVTAISEEFEIGASVERISVKENGRTINFIHDFDNNMTGITDQDRCYVLELDPAAVLSPDVLLLQISRGDATWDVSRVRSQLRAVLPALQSFAQLSARMSPDCLGKPTYRLERDDSPSLRKRSAEEPAADYMHFAGKHVQEINIRNLQELLQYEKEHRA